MTNQTMTLTFDLDDWATVYAGLRSAALALRQEAHPEAAGPSADCDRMADRIMAHRRALAERTETGPGTVRD